MRKLLATALAASGEGFPVLEAGRQPRTGTMDVDALELYVKGHPLPVPGLPDRITRLD